MYTQVRHDIIGVVTNAYARDLEAGDCILYEPNKQVCMVLKYCGYFPKQEPRAVVLSAGAMPIGAIFSLSIDQLYIRVKSLKMESSL